MDLSQVMALMTRFAPLVLAMLGQQKKQAGLDSAGVADLVSVLGQVLGQQGGLPGQAGQATGAKQGGGLMDLLGKIFGSGR